MKTRYYTRDGLQGGRRKEKRERIVYGVKLLHDNRYVRGKTKSKGGGKARYSTHVAAEAANLGQQIGIGSIWGTLERKRDCMWQERLGCPRRVYWRGKWQRPAMIDHSRRGTRVLSV